VPDQLAGVASSGQLLTDGLWARLRRQQKRVVLLLTDSVSGVIWPPVVAAAETTTGSWAALFERAAAAGLVLTELFSVASDRATGLASYLDEALDWVIHQRCIFHLWRHLASEFAAGAEAAARGLTGAACAAKLRPRLAAALVYRRPDNTALIRASPEWCWRDFRLRLGRGRNHFSEQRLERTALVWAIYRNVTPAQHRSERQRSYRHPGQCPLAVAGFSPDGVSYLAALAI
jgi:hypothetical protein